MKRPFGSPWRVVATGIVLSVLLTACSALKAEQKPRYTVDNSRSVAVDAPPCRLFDSSPYRNLLIVCSEMVHDHVATPEAAPEINDLAMGADGTLYFVRSAAGEVWAMRDQDGDQFMDSAFLVVDGLELPLHVAVDGDTLFVVTADQLLRLDATGPDQFGAPHVLVENLRGESPLWPGAVQIGPDDRLYIGIGASETESGAVASVARDGSDRQVIATGLHNPLDIAWNPQSGDLWIADSRGKGAGYDAIFRVPAGSASPPNFGYPNCLDGTESACAEVEAPAFTFEDQSTPSSLAFYTGDEWPFWTGDLFVALAGSWNRVVPSGYALEVLDFTAEAVLSGDSEIVMPNSETTWMADSLDGFSLNDLGFFPEHPVDIVFDHQGWLYVALSEGRIYRLRPRPATE